MKRSPGRTQFVPPSAAETGSGPVPQCVQVPADLLLGPGEVAVPVLLVLLTGGDHEGSVAALAGVVSEQVAGDVAEVGQVPGQGALHEGQVLMVLLRGEFRHLPVGRSRAVRFVPGGKVRELGDEGAGRFCSVPEDNLLAMVDKMTGIAVIEPSSNIVDSRGRGFVQILGFRKTGSGLHVLLRSDGEFDLPPTLAQPVGYIVPTAHGREGREERRQIHGNEPEDLVCLRVPNPGRGIRSFGTPVVPNLQNQVLPGN